MLHHSTMPQRTHQYRRRAKNVPEITKIHRESTTKAARKGFASDSLSYRERWAKGLGLRSRCGRRRIFKWRTSSERRAEDLRRYYDHPRLHVSSSAQTILIHTRNLRIQQVISRVNAQYQRLISLAKHELLQKGANSTSIKPASIPKGSLSRSCQTSNFSVSLEYQ